MESAGLLIFLACVVTSATATCKTTGDSDDGLILVHTLFRHGNRTIEDNIYDTNPYGNESFYAPYGYEQLTKEGKRTEYKLGQALRERYDAFLGPEYNVKLTDARSTTTNRTKASLLLVLAGLFPPTQESLWLDSLPWEPIPYNTLYNDKELYGRKVCANYKTAFKKLEKSDDVVKAMKPYQEMLDYLSEHTGNKIQKPKKVADLYIELITQQKYGYPLEDWTEKYMDDMYDVTIYTYHLMAGTKKLRKLSTGYFLRKLIQDTEYRIDNPESPTKMYLYAAHEKNIATLLVTLDAFDDVIPSFGSYVIVEVHRISGIYGLKLFYQNYQAPDPVLLTIPGCDEFCPLSTFKEIVANYIPDDSDCDLVS